MASSLLTLKENRINVGEGEREEEKERFKHSEWRDQIQALLKHHFTPINFSKHVIL